MWLFNMYMEVVVRGEYKSDVTWCRDAVLMQVETGKLTSYCLQITQH